MLVHMWAGCLGMCMKAYSSKCAQGAVSHVCKCVCSCVHAWNVKLSMYLRFCVCLHKSIPQTHACSTQPVYTRTENGPIL